MSAFALEYSWQAGIMLHLLRSENGPKAKNSARAYYFRFWRKERTYVAAALQVRLLRAETNIIATKISSLIWVPDVTPSRLAGSLACRLSGNAAGQRIPENRSRTRGRLR